MKHVLPLFHTKQPQKLELKNKESQFPLKKVHRHTYTHSPANEHSEHMQLFKTTHITRYVFSAFIFLIEQSSKDSGENNLGQ